MIFSLKTDYPSTLCLHKVMKIAIITGASSGIGREFVRQMDATLDVDEMWVIARRADRLTELQSDVKTKVVPLSLDLTAPADVEAYQVALQEAKPVVTALVNAAGYGKIGKAEELSSDEQIGMVDLNVRALTEITLLTLPYMEKGSMVWQIASLSSFMPLPYLSVYAATKAYVLSFSRSLAREVKARGIRIMAVCPGWVRTEFLARAQEEANALRHYGCFYRAPKVVSRAMKDMKKGKTVSIYGAQTRALIILSKVLPHTWVVAIWHRLQK